jgi:hypothetical protein
LLPQKPCFFHLYFSFACSKREFLFLLSIETNQLPFYLNFPAFMLPACFCPQAGRPRHRNPESSGPGAISLRSMAPAKAAYAATGIVFSIKL